MPGQVAPKATVADVLNQIPAAGADLPVEVGAQPPADPAIRKLAEDFADSLKYSFAIAAADDQVERPGSADRIFREYLNTRSASVRATYRNQARSALGSSTTRATAFGRYAAIEPRQYAKAGSDQLFTLVAPSRIEPKHLAERVAEAKRPRIQISPDAAKHMADLMAGSKYTKLGLFLKYVSCKEETDEVGSDEIALGGVFTSADGKTTTKIARVNVSGDFDEGESVVYPPIVLDLKHLPNWEELKKIVEANVAKPGRKLAEWRLRSDLGWPVAYPAAITMMERDDGGFSEFIDKLWKKVGDDLQDYIEKGLKSLGQAYLGELGAILGQALAWVINSVLSFLASLIGENADDHVATVPFMLALGAATKSYYDKTGLTKLPHPDVFTVNFHGDGGRYKAGFYFQIYA
jgi:hypothetical protein